MRPFNGIFLGTVIRTVFPVEAAKEAVGKRKRTSPRGGGEADYLSSWPHTPFEVRRPRKGRARDGVEYLMQDHRVGPAFLRTRPLSAPLLARLVSMPGATGVSFVAAKTSGCNRVLT